MNKKIIDAIKGGLWGLIVGDALGVPVEFQDREELEKNPVIDMRSDGIHIINQKEHGQMILQ